jgi:hypothetical protein
MNGWRIYVVCCLVLQCAVAARSEAQQSDLPRALGFQKRHGDEIMVCGQLYRIGTPVKLWLDPGGFDAYRTTRHFSPFEKREWKSTVEEMQSGKINFVTKPQESSPVDVCGTSSQCFFILHDIRGLSVHFMLDADGTIYQTLDLKERAWHATKSNDRSIGIEIAKIGAYPIPQTKDPTKDQADPFSQWYARDEQGVFLTFPPKIRGVDRFAGRKLRPRRPEILKGKLGDTRYQQYDYTSEQYAALIKLTAALSDIFPQIRMDVPRGADGTRMDTTLTDEQWASFSGILGHYHVQGNKSDPGPAMDWEYLLEKAKTYRAEALARGLQIKH